MLTEHCKNVEKGIIEETLAEAESGTSVSDLAVVVASAVVVVVDTRTPKTPFPRK